MEAQTVPPPSIPRIYAYKEFVHLEQPLLLATSPEPAWYSPALPFPILDPFQMGWKPLPVNGSVRLIFSPTRNT